MPNERKMQSNYIKIAGKHILQGKQSKDFDPFIRLGGAAQSVEDARSKLLVNFDPTMFFLEDLKVLRPENIFELVIQLSSTSFNLVYCLICRKNSLKRLRYGMTLLAAT